MNSLFSDPAAWSRIQFAFTIIYHYLFPQLTMGLAWFLVYWKWRALRTGDDKYNHAVRFWAKIFGLNFALGVVTGIPMEFHSGHECFHAASGGVPHRSRWLAWHRQSQYLSVESLGLGAVRPQSNGRAGDRLVRGDSRGSLVYPARAPSDPGSTLSARGNVYGADRVRSGGLSDRRPASQDGRQAPAGNTRGHGR